MIDANGWNDDMSEAPRDGTPVDLWSAHGYRLPDCAFDWIGDWMGWTGAMHHGSVEEAGPFTAWRPLPEPPVTA